MADFPPIDPKSLLPLRILASQLADNGALLDAPECPYGPEIKDFLKVFVTKKAGSGGFLGQFGDKWGALEAETEQLFKALRDYQSKIPDSDVTERMSYFRTATQLLEKIVSINERAMGLKALHEFQQTMLAIIDSELTPVQRDGVMARLRATIDTAPEETK